MDKRALPIKQAKNEKTKENAERKGTDRRAKRKMCRWFFTTGRIVVVVVERKGKDFWILELRA